MSPDIILVEFFAVLLALIQTLRSELIGGGCAARPRCGRTTSRSDDQQLRP
jgi:hypothetical protein